MGLPESYWKNQNWNWLRISVRQLNISAQRVGLDAVPCTKTTGMSPGRYAVVETREAAESEVSRAWTLFLPRTDSGSALENVVSCG